MVANVAKGELRGAVGTEEQLDACKGRRERASAFW